MDRRPRARCLAALVATVLLVPPAAADPAPFLSRHRPLLLVTAAGGAAATATAAIVTRREANDRYREYQRTADPDRITVLYEETRRLDNRAAALFIASEALFLGAIYLGFFVEPAPSAAAGAPGPPPRRSLDLRLTPEPAGLAIEWRF